MGPGGLGQGSSSSENRSSNMVSLRPSDGTDAHIPNLEPTRVGNTHELSFTAISDLWVELCLCPDRESEEKNPRRPLEDIVMPALPTPARKKARVMPMSSTEVRYKAAENLNQRPTTVSMDLPSSSDLQLGQAMVEMHKAGDETSHKEDRGDGSLVSKGKEPDVPKMRTEGESSDSLETRYLNSWCKSPSVTSRRQARQAAFKRWNPIVSPIRKNFTARTPHTKCYSRRSKPNIDKVEVNKPQMHAVIGQSDVKQLVVIL